VAVFRGEFHAGAGPWPHVLWRLSRASFRSSFCSCKRVRVISATLATGNLVRHCHKKIRLECFVLRIESSFTGIATAGQR